MTMINHVAAARRVLAPTSLALAVVVAAPAVAAPGNGFIERFNGTWTGKGEVLRNEDGKTRDVNCRVENTTVENTSLTEGECRAMVIFKREIGSEITLQPDGTFTGVYRGADTGPAQLVGSLNGDTLEFEMTYAKPVFGDNKAVMKIINADDGTYSVSVYDNVESPDELTQVSRIDFNRVD